MEVDASGNLARIGDDEWVKISFLSGTSRAERAKQAKAGDKAEMMIRKAYASKLRETFLDRSMDIKVSVAGQHAERLMLRYPLFGDVWVHQFQKGDLAEEIRSLGFKKVDFNDGYDYHVVLTFR